LKAINRKYTESGVIMSGDADALKKLKAKLANLESSREKMKKTNAAWRKYDKKGDDSGLRDLGLDDAGIAELSAEIEKAYSWEKQPYPSYTLSNLGQNIRSVKKRIEGLEAKKAIGNKEFTKGDLRIVQNADISRIQIFFPGKPDADIRSLLKSNGFRWSGENGCWQCYFTSNGIRKARYALDQLNDKPLVEKGPTQ
jgi:acyl carrier protein